MATYFVASGGSNTAPYDTWAKAATSLATALGAATTSGDVVVIQYNAVPTTDAEVSADTTYNIYGIAIVSASNDGGSAYTPTAMGTSYWIGNSTTNRTINFNFGSIRSKCYFYGLTLRTAGSTNDIISINSGSGANGPSLFQDCYFWNGNSNSSSTIRVQGANGEFRFLGCTFRFGSTSQSFDLNGTVELIGCSLSASGSTPTNLLSAAASAGQQQIRFIGCDLSLVTNTLVPSITGAIARVLFERCKLGSGVVVLAAQTNMLGLSEVWVLDCHTGDTHMVFGYYNGLGSLTKDTGIYYTTTGASWKIVTTSYCGRFAPFVTPWIDWYHDGTSSITPYFEVLRDGSSTAYKDHELWAEFTAKVTSGVTTASQYQDRASAANYLTSGGSDQATGAGAGSWTGEGGALWSGKIDSGSSFTPAEVGYIRGRIQFAVASETVYIDPVIRT